MQIGGNEAMYPVMGAIKWIAHLLRDAGHAAAGAIDVLLGHLAWIAVRLIGCRPSTSGSWPPSVPSTRRCAILAFPAGVLTGLAFAAPIAAFAATQNNDVAFAAIYRFGAHPALSVLGDLLPGHPAARAGCSRWPTPRRSTTG